MKAFLNWSGGKDSAFCLYKAIKSGINIHALITTVQPGINRVSMHGVRKVLVEQQAEALQLPLHTIELPLQPDMMVYEDAIRNSNMKLVKDGFTHAVSGDLFLEDLKNYRTRLYAKDNIDCLFPLWKMDTSELLREFFESGFRAVIVCVNSAFLNKTFCGRLLDAAFIRDLPEGVDPCGENGEYHSFVFDGPIFQNPVPFVLGDLVFSEYKAPQGSSDENPAPNAGFYFQDLIAGTASTH